VAPTTATRFLGLGIERSSWALPERNRLSVWIVNLVDGALAVHREPEPSADAAFGARYRAVEVLRPPMRVTPLAAPAVTIPVADLLP
jgi:hypothetical protein